MGASSAPVDVLVEPPVQRDDSRLRLEPRLALHLLQQTLRLVQLRVGQVLCCQTHREAVKHTANVIKLDEFVDGEVGDNDTAMRDDRNEAFCLQTPRRLAERRAAGAETLGDIFEPQPFARMQFAIYNGGIESLVNEFLFCLELLVGHDFVDRFARQA